MPDSAVTVTDLAVVPYEQSSSSSEEDELPPVPSPIGVCLISSDEESQVVPPPKEELSKVLLETLSQDSIKTLVECCSVDMPCSLVAPDTVPGKHYGFSGSSTYQLETGYAYGNNPLAPSRRLYAYIQPFYGYRWTIQTTPMVTMSKSAKPGHHYISIHLQRPVEKILNFLNVDVFPGETNWHITVAFWEGSMSMGMDA